MDTDALDWGRILLAGPSDACAAISSADDDPWEWLLAHSPGEALWRLRNESGVDAVVVAPGSQLEDYLELCRHTKYCSSRSSLSVVFVLEESLSARRVQVYQAGADDCIQLPAERSEILLRLLSAIRLTRTTGSLEDATAVITALANAIEGKDHYTCGHVERVATYSVEIGKRLGISGRELANLRTGALVHDIGKVVVPDHVLNKPGRLTEEEFDIIKRHPLIGHDILRSLRTFKEVVPIVRWHHERPNGTGYPDGIGGDDLPLLPRIVAVADCFDALSTDRPYRPAMSLEECKDILVRCSERGELDPEVTQLLFEIIQTGETALTASTA